MTQSGGALGPKGEKGRSSVLRVPAGPGMLARSLTLLYFLLFRFKRTSAGAIVARDRGPSAGPGHELAAFGKIGIRQHVRVEDSHIKIDRIFEVICEPLVAIRW